MKLGWFVLGGMPVLLGAAAPVAGGTATPDAARLALAEQVLVASGNDARLAAIDKGLGIYKVLADALRADLPNATPEKVDASVQAEITFEHAAVFAKNREIYATRFSAAELGDMLNFYRSPGGRALVAQTPGIVQEKTAFGRELANGLAERMKRTACADGTCPKS